MNKAEATILVISRYWKMKCAFGCQVMNLPTVWMLWYGHILNFILLRLFGTQFIEWYDSNSGKVSKP